MQHKTITDWAWQILLQVARWMPSRKLVVVGDGTYAALDFLQNISRRLYCVSMVTRSRLDACLYDPPPSVREAGKRGPNPLKGKKQPKLASRLTDPRTQWKKYTLSWDGGDNPRDGDRYWYGSVVSISHPSCRDPLGAYSRDPQGKYESMALLCTDQEAEAVQIVE